MANKIYYSKTTRTGGGATALDSIDGVGLVDGDFGYVTLNAVSFEVYKLKEGSAGPTGSFPPATNPGTKKWEFLGLYQTPIASGFTVSGGTTAKTLTVSENVTIDHGLPNRNAIINGGMDIWQRGTATLTNPATTTYFPDRFVTVHVLGDGTFNLLNSAETVAVNFPFANSLKHDCTHIETAVAAGEYATIQYKIEGYDFKRFEGEVATLSFWAKAVKAGIYCVSLQNNAADKSYVHEFTLVANTWTKVAVTLTFNSGGTFLYTTGVGLRISWAVMCGSTFQTATANKDTWVATNSLSTDAQVNGLDSTDNNFWLTGIQLELGSVVTAFEFRPYAQELELCHRYYERFAPGVVTGSYAVGFANGTSRADVVLFFEKKRTLPTIGFSGVDDFIVSCVAGSYATTDMVATSIGMNSAYLYTANAASLTSGQAVILRGENSTTHWIDVDAEL